MPQQLHQALQRDAPVQPVCSHGYACAAFAPGCSRQQSQGASWQKLSDCTRVCIHIRYANGAWADAVNVFHAGSLCAAA